MRAILSLFWQICLLRQSPALVPENGVFAAVVVLANLLCSVLVSGGFSSDASVLTTATSIIVSQASTAGLIWMALSWSGKSSRFITTITAIFGCDLIITACFSLLIPVSAMLGTAVASVILLLFLVWSVTVAGFILHRALETRFSVGVGVAMGISVLSVILGQVAIGA